MRSALLAEQAYRQRYKELAQQITEDELKNMKSQMATFKKHLESFAVKYKDDIRKDPEFRAKFQQMCAHIGVDPLASNKNKWSELLGLGDFYYELGIQVIEVCMFLRSQPRYGGGGGLVDLNAVHQRVTERRSKLVDKPTKEDIEVAIKKLSCLGGGWAIVSIGGHRYVRCVPSELSTDGNVVLDYASKRGGYFCQSQALKDMGWSEVQLNQAVQGLVSAGMLLVDDEGGYSTTNSGIVRYYWFPAYGMEASIGRYKAEFNLSTVK